MVFNPRIGVYICHCGINIASTVDINELTGFAASLPKVVIARNYTYMCSDPGQMLIKKDIEQLEINRVVVASCSPRMHEPTFRNAVASAGLNPYCFEMANIREQCSWVHQSSNATTRKAMDLVASAVAKATRLQPLEIRQVPVTPSALIIGGGIAGLQAALDIADAGFQVVLIERTSQLGGHVTELYTTFPNLQPARELLHPLVERVNSHIRIEVMQPAELVEIEGFVGNFQASIQHDGQLHVVPVGSIIIATGFDVFDPHVKKELGYGLYPQVITSLEFERLSSKELLTNGCHPEKVVFIQCVGSRDQTVGNSYCSRTCCMVTARQAMLVSHSIPEADVTVFYMDVRAYGKGFEEFYDLVRESGVMYRRGNPSEIIQNGESLLVRAEDTLLGEVVEVEADLVVLAAGMVPRQDGDTLASLLKLSRTPDGFFMEAHPKLRPVDTSVAGVFLAGCCQGPKDITDTIAQARAAASAAMIPMLRGQVQIEAATAFVDEELCAGCGQCAHVCTYGALTLHPFKDVMTVNQVLCQGCSACAAVCPSGAVAVNHFTFEQTMAQVEALLAGTNVMHEESLIHEPSFMA